MQSLNKHTIQKKLEIAYDKWLVDVTYETYSSLEL